MLGRLRLYMYGSFNHVLYEWKLNTANHDDEAWENPFYGNALFLGSVHHSIFSLSDGDFYSTDLEDSKLLHR